MEPTPENNYSKAKRTYWKNITPEERSAFASRIAKEGHARKTPEERRAHALKMVAGRNKKRDDYRKEMMD